MKGLQEFLLLYLAITSINEVNLLPVDNLNNKGTILFVCEQTLSANLSAKIFFVRTNMHKTASEASRGPKSRELGCRRHSKPTISH